MNKRRKKMQKPDDYFSSGPFEFARFGKTTIGRSNATPEQMAIVHQRMAEAFPKIVVEIDELVKLISLQVSRLPPKELLQRAWWEFAALMIKSNSGGIGFDQLASMRMIDYIQSIVAAVEPAGYVERISDEDWQKLQTDVRTLFNRLTIEYQSCLTAHRKSQNPELDMDLEDFRVRAEILWLNIRGKRYHAHEKQALLDVLMPHSDVLLRLYGVDAHFIVGELDKILAKLTGGLAQAFKEFDIFRNDTLDRMFQALEETSPDVSFEDIRDRIFQDTDLAAQRDSVMGALFGFDLFDVAKNTSLPDALIKDLTWLPNEDKDFFSSGDFRGWPLRIWPIMRRPFISLEGRAYCFDIFSLFDNIYRVFRRIIIYREPSYAGLWNDRQKAVSEELPIKYLTSLLPQAIVYTPIYYKWKTAAGGTDWHEADGLIIYGDHLFVIEVKAGAFTYTSPANDLPAHLASLKALLEAPVRQGSRFVDYLESDHEVSITNAEHQEIARLSRKNFRHITICAITLDAFTELAARAQHLKGVGIQIGQRQVWPLSIDDLRVYSEIFDNPLIFLHFVEQRGSAGQSEHVDLADELDHLGLYLERNNYGLVASDMKARHKLSKINFDGFRAPIDKYYEALTQGETPMRPQQKMPVALADIITFLTGSTEPSRIELVSFLMDGAGEFRDNIADAIKIALQKNRELSRAIPMSSYGEMEMTLYIWSPAVPRNKPEAIQHTQAVMVANNEDRRRLIELEYDEGGKLLSAEMTHITFSDVSYEVMEHIKAASRTLVEQRLKQAKTKGKIGRNDTCPCGSRKKYKRCHGQ